MEAIVVSVSLDHPQIAGSHIINIPVAIDAHDKEHARRRLREELQIIVGKARLAK